MVGAVSFDAINLVRSRRVASANRKAVLVAIADHADATWSCYIGQARLAAELELGERTVRRILAALEREGLIRRDSRYRSVRGRTSDRTFLVREAIADLPATRADLPANESRSTGHSLAGEPPDEPPDESPELPPRAATTLVEMLDLTDRARHVYQELYGQPPSDAADGWLVESEAALRDDDALEALMRDAHRSDPMRSTFPGRVSAAVQLELRRRSQQSLREREEAMASDVQAQHRLADTARDAKLRGGPFVPVAGASRPSTSSESIRDVVLRAYQAMVERGEQLNPVAAAHYERLAMDGEASE